MKKIFVFIVCLSLLLLTAGAVSAEAQVIADKSGTTVVKYEVSSKYTLQIPASMTVNSGSTTHMEIGVSDLVIGQEKCVNITVSSTQFNNTYADGGLWRLKLEGSSDEYMHYHIHKKVDGTDTPIKNMTSAFVVSATAFDGKDVSYTATQVLYFKLDENAVAEYSGDYTDNLVFTAKVEDAPVQA